MTRVSVLAAILAGAFAGANCGGGGDDGGDDDGPDPDDATCAELRTAWHTIVDGLPTEGCTSAAGCWAYPHGSAAYTCEGSPEISTSAGARRTPPPDVAARLTGLETQYYERCDGGQGPDTPPVTAECIDQQCVVEYGTCFPEYECQNAVDSYTAIAATLDRSCETVADCVLLWDNIEQFPTCDCTPYLTHPCEGIPVAAAALTPAIQAQLADLRNDFFEVCDDGVFGTCDCAPQDMFCSEAGLCSLGTANTCFGPPPDAPPPDASPDASP